jgi:large subunit ribosomal protein L24
MKIIKGDKIQVLIGKDKGRQGEVYKCLPKKKLIFVKDINTYKKHVKSTKDQKGGIIEKVRGLLVSKVALVCPNCQKMTRVGYQIDKAGDKMRFCKKCKNVITNNKKSSK